MGITYVSEDYYLSETIVSMLHDVAHARCCGMANNVFHLSPMLRVLQLTAVRQRHQRGLFLSVGRDGLFAVPALGI